MIHDFLIIKAYDHIIILLQKSQNKAVIIILTL